MITRAAAMLIVLCGLLSGCALETPVQSAPSDGIPEDAEAMTVAHVHDGEFINESLVADGYATVLVYEPNTRYEPQLREAEADAEAATRGLWGRCR